MVVKQAIPGNAFDVDIQVSAELAKDFVDAGYIACGRYFPRTPALVPGNLTATELAILLGAGLSVFAVQHAPLPNWRPNAAIGVQYGQYAGAYGKSIGYPAGAPIYCDIESVLAGTPAQNVIDYFTNWASEVVAAGYVASLYVGWGTQMIPQQIYDLPTKSYWRSYNYDDGVPVRGYQIIQHVQKTFNGITYDPNTIQADELGDLPIFVSP